MTKEQNNTLENNDNVRPRGFTSKKNLIFLILVAVLTFAIGGAVLVTGVSNTPENRLSRHMRAAERYLAEMDYERAVIEYQRALEIEPMNVDAILGLADAYIGLGDTDKVIEVLRDGLERTGDDRIRAKLEELEKQTEPPVPSESETIPSEPEESEELPPVPSESEETPSESEESEEPPVPSESKPSSNEPKESESVIGSSSSVNICGVDIDIATTKSLLIYNSDNWDQRYYHRYDYEILYEANSDVVIYLSNDMDVENMKKIRQLSRLQCLRIEYADLSKVNTLAEAVSELTELTELGLYCNEIDDISSLSRLKNLTTLDLAVNKINDISSIKSLTNLKYLYLSGNSINNIDSLKYLTNLEFLEMSGSEISDISSLSSLRKLRYLDLGGNEISDLRPLADLTNLGELYLYHNRISDIRPLSKLKKLSVLNLYHNEIRDIDPLSSLTDLKRLNLGRNEISDIIPLTSLTNLTLLDLWSIENDVEENKERIEWLKEQLPDCDIYLAD